MDRHDARCDPIRERQLRLTLRDGCQISWSMVIGSERIRRPVAW